MQELPTTPETANPDESPAPETKSGLQSLRDLLNVPEGEAGREAVEKAEPKKAEQTTAKPKSLKALAETLKVADKDLYDIEIPMSNGESRTLGQLKDLVAKQDDFTLRELTFEEDRQRKEAELTRAQSELRELLSHLPANALKPEVVNALREKHETTMKQERARTLEVIPEWNDEARRTEEIAGIVDHLESYGFPKNYLASVVDHRTIKYIRENYLREQRLRRALEQVKQQPATAPAKSKPAPGKKSPTAGRRPGERPRDALAALFQDTNR